MRREHTFHRSWRRAWGGECVNIGEGPFARLVKGLDAERVRGRLIKPLDFVCVAWSFIQGDKSATTGTQNPREKWFNERKVNMREIVPNARLLFCFFSASERRSHRPAVFVPHLQLVLERLRGGGLGGAVAPFEPEGLVAEGGALQPRRLRRQRLGLQLKGVTEGPGSQAILGLNSDPETEPGEGVTIKETQRRRLPDRCKDTSKRD